MSNMDSATTATEADSTGRKRKWSPLNEDSEEESFTGRSVTEARDDSATPETLPGSDTEISRKRPRTGDIPDSTGATDIPGLPEKEGPRLSPFPLEVWQHICSFLEPVSLGRLIRVNRTLNALLDPQKPVPEHMTKQSKTQNDIWAASRKRLLPGLPRPLSWTSELDMWRLILGTSCQFCGKKSSKMLSTTPSLWTSGPGLESVRVIWPFALRSCGNCLTSRMIKDTNLWFSHVSILLTGLPSAYFTPELNFITSVTLRNSSPPPGVNLTRFYLQEQLDLLKEDMSQASSLGQATSEEWIKGLDTVGRQKMEDAKRFEHWEATGGLQALLSSRVKYGLPAKPILPALSLPNVPTHVQAQSRLAESRTQSPLSAHYRPSPPAPGVTSGFNTPHLPLKPASPAPGQFIPGFSQNSTAVIQAQGQHVRLERNVTDLNQRKAQRRAEIERRCLQLDPPIKPSTLPYMTAFNNSMLISMALNENAWEVLKPMLLAQRDAALKKEEEFSAANQNLQTQAEDRREQEEQLQQARTLLERQRDEAQRPVREKLAAYADELLGSEWDGGSFVTKDNAPQFAADLLIHVRHKFFEAVAESDRVLEMQGTSVSLPLPGSNSDRHLTLEDMKWVYETKIKPITQCYSKEIFLCGACDVDRKHYALDAVIQHYAAKHTNDFSHGSAIVYWKANWPFEPPFDKKPISSPRNRNLDHNSVSPMYQRDFTRPQQFDPGFAVPEQIYPTRPAFAMTPNTAPRPLPRYTPSAYSVDEEPYQPRSRLVPVQTSNTVPRHGMYGERAPYETYYGPVAPVSPAFSPHGLVAAPHSGYAANANRRPYPVQRYDISTMSPFAANGYGHPPPPPTTGHSSRLEPRPLPQPGQPSGLHQTQIAELASNAREIWDGTDGIDNLPDSVRTHVIIHHVVLRFREKYTNEPTLALFADALLNSSQMRPLINLGGLLCKACASQDDHTSTYDAQSTKYNVLELLQHFQINHIESMMPRVADTDFEVHRPDWKFDMVLLPDERIIKSLIESPGMTDAKLLLIASVLLRYFPDPLPKLNRAPEILSANSSNAHVEELTRSHIRNHSPSVAYEDVHDFIPLKLPTNDAQSLAAIPDQGQQEQRPRVAEVVREDEYDPHRPAPTHVEPIHKHELQQPRSLYHAHIQPYDNEQFENIVHPYGIVAPRNPRNIYYPFNSSGAYSYENPARSRPYANYCGDRDVRHSLTALHQSYKSSRAGPRSLVLDRTHDQTRSPVQQVKLEAARSPPRNSAAGTAQFLNDFDVDEGPGDRRNTPDQASLPDRVSNNTSSHRSGQAIRGTRHPRDRLDALERTETGATSRRGTPHKAMSRNATSTRSRSPSVAPRDVSRNHEDEPHFRYPAHLPFEDKPVQQAQYSDPRYFDRPIYQDELVPRYHQPLQRYRTRSPGRGHQEIPIRYVDARILPRYPYLDEDHYQQAGEEYVQLTPPRENTRRVERRIVQEQHPDYTEDIVGYGRAIDDRGGRVYEEVQPPRRQVRYDPYDDRRRYE